jgi:hypothetical protein
VVATDRPRLRRSVRYARSPGLRRHRVALTTYQYNSKLTIKVNRKLLTSYGILTPWPLLTSVNVLRSLFGV